ncbi:hypothetical protein PsAD5_03540 [Pseudovibrio sp. Ad5]|nr:hypothetical protein PsAD5_03540 [Pseudovibrio sp. Ad5]KZK98765.1 hypothetical protein PsW74_03354 [Pseudovibrio sp. W74]KZL09258.1 hypothetical protein PsAD14_02319 [Pseudovibrio sp. Ad14]
MYLASLEFAVKLTKAKATVFAALFVLMQLVAPPGMMVSGGEDGFEIVICTAQGMRTVLLDEQGNELPQAEEQKAYDNCAFGSVVAKALSTSPHTEFGGSPLPIDVVSLPTSVALAETTVRIAAPRAPPV